ncbi:MAG: PQQ-dependent sugar dehydrogenase [Candidatus Limnocylindrales bacterium]
MVRPAASVPPRPSRRPLRIALVAAIVFVMGLLLVALATRSRWIPGVGVAGPTRFPSLTAPSAAGGSRSLGAPFDPARVAVTLDPVVGGLTAPLAIVNAGDGSGRLFIAEQGGTVRIARSGAVLPAPFLDVAAEITSGGERGLLGLAFHPEFPADPRVFVDYTDARGDTQISSFVVDPAIPDRVDPASELRLLHVEQPFANHNGGALLFDPDGMLLVSLGDGGSGGDPQDNGQSLETLLGKVLRIDVDRPAAPTGGRPYGIPADNPYADGDGGRRPEIWLTGLRNPWRMSIDRATGDLWIGDVGQDAWEEIDVRRAAALGATNFGWNRMEGTHCFEPEQNCEDPAFALPISDYGHDLGCTVVGGNVYGGTAQAALIGGYVFADYCSGRVFAIDPIGDTYRSPVEVLRSDRSLSAFGEDEAGELYVVDIAGGELLRVAATRR